MHEGDDEIAGRDDLVAEAVHTFLSEAIGAVAREEIDLPHIVICTDLESAAVSYSGPYPDGVSALIAADREAELDRRAGSHTPMTFSVAALLPGAAPIGVPERDI